VDWAIGTSKNVPIAINTAITANTKEIWFPNTDAISAINAKVATKERSPSKNNRPNRDLTEYLLDNTRKNTIDTTPTNTEPNHKLNKVVS